MGKVIEFKRSGKVNGWANWDTWEAYNIITSDVRFYNLILDVARNEQFTGFKPIVEMVLEHFYFCNDVSRQLKSNLAAIDLVELHKIIRGEAKSGTSTVSRSQYGPKSKTKARSGSGEGSESGSSAVVAQGDKNVTR